MKKLLLSCVATTFIGAHATNAQSTKFEETSITKEGLVYDLDAYKKGIDQKHIDPYTVIKRSDFFDRIEQIKDSADAYNIDELYVKLLQVNALIQDEHTYVKTITRQIIPFYMHWYDEGIFIIATNDENRKIYHSRIVAINEIPIDQVARKVATIIPDTNTAALRQYLPGYICDPFILRGLQITTEREKITFTVITPINETLKVSPHLIDVRDNNMITGFKTGSFLRSSVKGRYWFKYVDTANCIYFNYSSCVDDGLFEHTITELEKTIEEKKPGKIIIDMRYNSGGNSKLLQPFIDYITQSTLNKKGSLYVLIGHKTFSSAVLNALTFRQQTNALFIGEETAGSVEHFGEARSFTLPRTNLKVTYSTRQFKSDEEQKGSFRPDINIPEKFSEYDNNIDSVVDYALRH